VSSNTFTKKLLTWYKNNARTLPWRESRDPYAIWVSEVMLQQTRVKTVIPYYQKWMLSFPNIQTLANTSQQEILSTWEGLGYYSRARNLHKAAQILAEHFNGELPQDTASLIKLPGIGRYTANAIASIAFNADVATLDGNIRRVLSRVFNVDLPAGSKESEKRLLAIAAENLPPGNASAYNQALMELGATICTPHSPKCESCPLKSSCQANLLGIQDKRPLRKSKANIPHHTVTAAVIFRDKKVLITQRKPNGILGGMWEFPGGKLKKGETLAECLQREIMEELGTQIQIKEPFGIYNHAYTHFSFTLHAFQCSISPMQQPKPLQVQTLQWINPNELPNFPMGKVDRQIANRILKEIPIK